jgi:hypothetical protein
VKVGDLVKMRRGYSSHGIVLAIVMPSADGWSDCDNNQPRWVRILWSDYGPGVEKFRDLEVVN